MLELIKFFLRRIKRDQILLEAAALTFTTMLALVPALTVVLSVFTMIPSFESLKKTLQDFSSSNFLPVFSETVSRHIADFAAKAGSLTLTGSLVLVVIALVLVRAVDRTINRIWRGGKRRVTMTFAIYWTLLTVGPLATALTLWVFSRILTFNIEGLNLSIASQIFYFILPVLIEFSVITTIYIIVPATLVRFQDAVAGGLLVTVLFEVLKKLFAVFIMNFSDYEAIYGALAALPVLMIWICLSWCLVLIGAEFTSCLGLVRSGIIQNAPGLLIMFANLTSGTETEQNEQPAPKRMPSVRVRISKSSQRR